MNKFKDETVAKKVFNSFTDIIYFTDGNNSIYKKMDDRLIEINNLDFVTLTIIKAYLDYSISQLSIKYTFLSEQKKVRELELIEVGLLESYSKDLDYYYYFYNSILNMIAERKSLVTPSTLKNVTIRMQNKIDNYQRIIGDSIRRKKGENEDDAFIRGERIKRLCFVSYNVSKALKELQKESVDSSKKPRRLVK